MGLEERSYSRQGVHEVLRKRRVGRFSNDDQQGNLVPLDSGELVRHVSNAAIVRYGYARILTNVLQPFFISTRGREQIIVALDV